MNASILKYPGVSLVEISLAGRRTNNDAALVSWIFRDGRVNANNAQRCSHWKLRLTTAIYKLRNPEGTFNVREHLSVEFLLC